LAPRELEVNVTRVAVLLFRCADARVCLLLALWLRGTLATPGAFALAGG